MIRLLVAVVAVTAALAGVAQAASYRYRGFVFDRARVTVRLDHATAHGVAHAAVWDGASGPDARVWVQAGIEDSGDGPQLYVEAANYPKCLYSLRTWPARFGEHERVRVVHHGDRWRAIIGGHSTRWTVIRHPNLIATLELYGRAAAVAHIDGHRVR